MHAEREKRGSVLQREPVLGLCLEDSYLFSKGGILGEVLGDDPNRILISLMLMCQNEIYSPDFICLWVRWAQMALIVFLLCISLSKGI